MKKPFSNNKAVVTLYSDLLAGIKIRIRQAQNQAVMSANAEMLCLYWDIGRMITVFAAASGWENTVLTSGISIRLPCLQCAPKTIMLSWWSTKSAKWNAFPGCSDRPS